MKGKSPVEKVKDTGRREKKKKKKEVYPYFTGTTHEPDPSRPPPQKKEEKKNPTMFTLYIFLGIHYSTASINRKI